MRHIVPTIWLVLSGLGGLAGFLSNPDYYVWVLIALVFVGIAYRDLRLKSNKQLLLISSGGIAIYSFSIGRLFFANHQLSDVGILCVLLVFPVMGFVVWRLYKSEVTAA
jgi:hypothetical protein